MNDTETRRIANAILEIVRKQSNGEILGAHLGSELRTAGGDPSAPLIFPGSLNLRQFIGGHVTELCEIRQQGMDVVYALGHEAGQKQAPEPPILDRRAWKTFVSPNGPFRLFINPQTKTFLVRSAKDEVESEPWVQLSPCSAEVHKKIAEEFAEKRDPEERAAIDDILQREVWWKDLIDWAASKGLSREWRLFRREHLFQKLKESLERLGVSIQILTPTKTEAQRSDPDVGTRSTAATAPTPDEVLRSLALSIVQRLSHSDLRELKLPLGEVFDELTNRN